MKFSLLGFAIAGGIVACASGSGTQRSETANHSHRDQHTEHAHDAEDEAPPVAPEDTAAATTASASTDPANEERVAYEAAQPVFQGYCAKCHTTEGAKSGKKALTHFNMDTYPFGGHHADEITATIRKALGAAGKDATMPRDQPGAVKGDELRLILVWADAYDRAHPTTASAKKHDHHHDHHGSGHEH